MMHWKNPVTNPTVAYDGFRAVVFPIVTYDTSGTTAPTGVWDLYSPTGVTGATTSIVDLRP